MVLSEKIAALIEELLNEQNGTLEIGRNELASRMGCVPSQINYVITSRFTPQKGYVVESRRGGGGYIRITRIPFDRNSFLMHAVHAVGDGIDAESARVFIGRLIQEEIVTPREGELIYACLSEAALQMIAREDREAVRAALFKNILFKLISL